MRRSLIQWTGVGMLVAIAFAGIAQMAMMGGTLLHQGNSGRPDRAIRQMRVPTEPASPGSPASIGTPAVPSSGCLPTNMASSVVVERGEGRVENVALLPGEVAVVKADGTVVVAGATSTMLCGPDQAPATQGRETGPQPRQRGFHMRPDHPRPDSGQ